MDLDLERDVSFDIPARGYRPLVDRDGVSLRDEGTGRSSSDAD